MPGIPTNYAMLSKKYSDKRHLISENIFLQATLYKITSISRPNLREF